MNKQITVLPGDGVGPEITEQSVNLLKAIADKYGHTFHFSFGLIGAAAIDKTGDPYPDATHNLCVHADAVLFGAIGDPAYDNNPAAKVRPEQGLLRMRKSLELYANLRPIFTFKNFISQSPLKDEIISGVDFIVIRELISGIYFGKQGRTNNNTVAFDTAAYSQEEILRIARYAFSLARNRRKQLTVVDKANVLETSRLWRETIQYLMKDNNDITVEFMFVDNAAMQLIKRPKAFDVIVTDNMFGDILTDEASVITGSIGMLPSASIGEKTAVYEPIHGSFPKAAGKNIANPIGSMLSAGMLLEYSFGLTDESKQVMNAVAKVLAQGYGTKDIASSPGKMLTTSQLGEMIILSLE